LFELPGFELPGFELPGFELLEHGNVMDDLSPEKMLRRPTLPAGFVHPI